MMSQLEIGLRQQVAEMLAKADDSHLASTILTEQPLRDLALGRKEGLESAARQLESFCNELFDS